MNDDPSDIDGFTIVYRTGRAARIHLLRPFNACNTERRKSGRNTVLVEGSREKLLNVLWGDDAVDCKRCFPSPVEQSRPLHLVPPIE